MNPHQSMGFGSNAKGVVRLQGDIFLKEHGRIVAFSTSDFYRHALV
jgi:hypothetical protein